VFLLTIGLKEALRAYAGNQKLLSGYRPCGGVHLHARRAMTSKANAACGPRMTAACM
jgi:hypothetical protein